MTNGVREIKQLLCALLYLSLLTGCGVARNASLPEISHTTLHREHPGLSEGQIDSLREIYGTNKIFAEEFIEPTLIALAHFPELREAPIEFKFSAEATTMAARPRPLSMLGSRRYIVVINNDEEFDGINLKEVPFNAQIGIIGHELSHIADYQKYNLGGVIGILLRYSSPKRKALFEQEIDRATIERGLGWQLYDWAEFSLDPANGSSKEYIEFKRTHYLTPAQIEQHINHFATYRETL